MTLPADLNSRLDAIRYSDDDLTKKREHVFALLKPLSEEDTADAYALAQDIIFPTPECRAVEFVRWLPNGAYTPASAPLTDRDVAAGVANALRFGITYLSTVSNEAADEISSWADVLELLAERSSASPTYKCQHCDADCTGTYAVLDDWVLCLTPSGGRPSCFTRVHDQGEALGGGR